LINTRN